MLLPKIALPPELPVVLASASPRRKELCEKAGLKFSIHVADCNECYDSRLVPIEAVELLSRRKAAAVERKTDSGTMIIASDTLVELDKTPLGKPKDEADAFRMLTALSGRQHFVRTGVAVIWNRKILSGVDSTAVFFHTLTEKQILSYVKTGEPMDKAGAYAIQGIGSFLVERIEGDFDTVMGLSVRLLSGLISRLFAGEGEPFSAEAEGAL